MLVLYETPAGYAIFKLAHDVDFSEPEKVWDAFSSLENAQERLQLVSFSKFENVDDELKIAATLKSGEILNELNEILESVATETEHLIVGDVELDNLIEESFDIQCIFNEGTEELMRAIHSNAEVLLAEHKNEIHSMRLALGRCRDKFNPKNADSMIVHACYILDDLDKELNNYAMRLREWYGWSFPELDKIIQDHLAYAKTVNAIGMKQNSMSTDLSAILPEELSTRVKEAAQFSTGTAASEFDITCIRQLCDQIIELMKYRTELKENLKARMNTLAPNVTVLLGGLVGARLISRAGSLVSLVKYSASDIQILGAEKALSRALKAKCETPKYAIIYHVQLVESVAGPLKGKIARKLAAKVSLAARIDALADESLGNKMGIEARAILEALANSESER